MVNVIRTRDPIYIRFCVEKGAIQALQSLSALRSENTEVRHLAMIGDLGVTAILQVEEYHKPKEKVWAQQARECRGKLNVSFFCMANGGNKTYINLK